MSSNVCICPLSFLSLLPPHIGPREEDVSLQFVAQWRNTECFLISHEVLRLACMLCQPKADPDWISWHRFNVRSGEKDQHLALLCFFFLFLPEPDENKSSLVAAPCEWRQSHVKVALCALLLNRVRDYNPDGVRGVMTTPQPWCMHYLVWLNSCSPGVWPQHNTEPTDLSRGIRKSPQHMWFMGSQPSLHISSYPQTAWATLSVFFPSVWVCYSFIYLVIYMSLHSSGDFLTN